MTVRAPLSLEFRLLGPLEVLRDGMPLDLGPRRQRAVLARLLIDAGRPVSVDRLLEDVWGGRPPDGAIRTLRSYLSRLRAVLGAGDAIASQPAGYVLAVDPRALDSASFERVAAEGRDLLVRGNSRAAAARLREALSLWRGEALADLPPEPFVIAEAARLEHLRVEALEDRIEADLALDAHGGLVAELEALVEQHPLRERLWRHLMLALYRAGRQADALAAYQRARTILDEELGLEPGEELRRLEGEILRHEVAPPESEPAHNLPAAITSFVGRARELAEVLDLLEHHRLVTLTGAGGAGKTRVALEAGRHALGRFPGGVWVVDLAPVADPGLVVTAVADAVDPAEGADRSDVSALLARIARLETLVILDNCEHVAEAAASVALRLVEAAPRLRVLATSREALAVTGERVYSLPPLGAPAMGDEATADPTAHDAVRLFLERGSVADEPDALAWVARICRELDGLPLAIEIAAAQTRLLTPAEIAARLEDRFRLLSYWSRTAAPRHQTLRASLDWSDALLADEERALLYRLSVFAGSFALDAAEAVAQDRDGALAALRRLVDASLVTPESGSAGVRFRMLETVRQYATERLASTEDPGEAAACHAAFFATLADRGVGIARTPEEVEVYARFDADLANLRAALDWSAEAALDLLIRLARGLGNYWRLRGHLEEGEAWLQRALDTAGTAPADVRADLHGMLGHMRLRRADFAGARDQLAAAIELAPEDSAQRGWWLHNLAFAWRAQGDFARARAVLEPALATAREQGDTDGAAHRLGHLADIAAMEGRFDEAQRLYDEAWALVGTRSASIEVAYLDSTARLAAARGDLDEAARRARAGLERARGLGDTWHVGLNLATLAFVARLRGDVTQAAEHLRHALAAMARLADRAVDADVLELAAAVLLDAGDEVAAATALGASDALRRAAGVPRIAPLHLLADEPRRILEARREEPAIAGAWAAGERSPAPAAIAHATTALEAISVAPASAAG